jgi:hypothetical protein
MTLRVTEQQHLILSYVDPATGAEVTAEYIIEDFE